MLQKIIAERQRYNINKTYFLTNTFQRFLIQLTRTKGTSRRLSTSWSWESTTSWTTGPVSLLTSKDLCATTYRNSKFDVDFVDFNRKIDNLTEKVIVITGLRSETSADNPLCHLSQEILVTFSSLPRYLSTKFPLDLLFQCLSIAFPVFQQCLN